MKQPKIELKNLKTYAGMSYETLCYSAALYVDGKRWGTVSNEGHGGPDHVDPIKGGFEAHKALNDRIKATHPPRICDLFPEGLAVDLEILCHEEACRMIETRDWQRRLKGQLWAIKDGQLYSWPRKLKPCPERFQRFREACPEYELLNDQSLPVVIEKVKGL